MPSVHDPLACEFCQSTAHPSGHVVLVTSNASGVDSVQGVHLVCGERCERANFSASNPRLSLAELSRGDVGDVLDDAVRRFDWSDGTIRTFAAVLRTTRERSRK